jgi:thymidylate synthase
MKQYQNLLQNILKNGVEKESGRANMPNTIGISHGVIQMNLQEGFPLLTTKKMYWKGIVHELLWFLHGNTNIKYLVDNNVNIWNDDAYRWYLKLHNDYDVQQSPLIMDEFINIIKTNDTITKYFWFSKMGTTIDYKLGDLGKVYGYQWRNQNGVDQIKDIIDGLKRNPYSRYHILDGWNMADFKDMALPPCHLLYQFIVRPIPQDERDKWAWDNGLKSAYQKELPKTYDEWTKWLDEHNVPKFYLDLNMYQRSCDTFLGIPFNCASMSLLLMIMAKASNMLNGVATWIGGDTHLYLDHIPMVKEQLGREPYSLPKMKINKQISSLEDILNLNIDDFELIDYVSHDAIKAELFTGLKKQ